MKNKIANSTTQLTVNETMQDQFLAILDTDGSILMMNEKMHSVFCSKNKITKADNFFNLVHPNQKQEFESAIELVTTKKQTLNLNISLKNGIYHPMQWKVNLLDGNTNQPLKILCQGSKINNIPSNYIQTKQPLDTIKDIYKSFAVNSPNLEWVVDENALLIYANKSFLKFFQLDESIINKRITDFLPVSLIDVLYGKHDLVHKSVHPVVTLERGKKADGSDIIFQVTLFTVETENNSKMVGGIACNQSEKFFTENKLAEATSLISSLKQVSSDAIWEWDMKNGTIMRNENLLKIIGVFPEDDMNIDWWLCKIHPDDRPKLNKLLIEVLANKLQSWSHEYRFQCQDGEYINIEDRGFVIYEKEVAVKMIGSLANITEEKLIRNLLEVEKLRNFKNISETVIRVQEQERSRLGREMHDNVNQILSTIKLFIEMLKPDKKFEIDIQDKIREYTLLAIEEIRILSREMVSPQLENESLAEYIKKLIEDIHLATPIKIKFTHDTDVELLSPAKKITIFRIVQEQIKNIIKYSKATETEILLQNNHTETTLIIKDNGVGLDLNKTNTGVGLASIKERVKFYNGHTNITSAPGEGFILHINLPA